MITDVIGLEDRNALAHAYFGLGVNSLAKGDWKSAKLNFERVLQTDQFPLYVHSWSHAFLQRMEDDPDWLPWLRKAETVTNGRDIPNPPESNGPQ